jgi:hypothetical protein
MKAFLKTLFGDVGTVAVVAVAVAVAVLLATLGQAAYAGFVIPPLVLAGAAWLALR